MPAKVVTGEEETVDMSDGHVTHLFIVDQDQLSNEQLQSLLDGGGFKLRIFISGDDFEKHMPGLPAGVILLSLDLPDRGCLDVLRAVKEAREDLPVIAMRKEPQVRAVVKAMRNGVTDFIEKPIAREPLVAALNCAMEILKFARAGAPASSIKARLTPRQFEVLKLLIAGKQNRRVGAALGISERTVEIHRARIMKQLEVKNFAALVRLATKQGIEP